MHRILRRVEGLGREEIFEIILGRYSKVCGNYGRCVFEEKVLPTAYKVFEGEPSRLVLELFRVIQIAGRIKLGEIENYLSKVVLDFNRLSMAPR